MGSLAWYSRILFSHLVCLLGANRMSKFSKPHSPGQPLQRQSYRVREHPWMQGMAAMRESLGQCEACANPAKLRIMYEEREGQPELSVIFLCYNHAKLARYPESFKKVLLDVDRKIEGKK